MYNPQPDRSAEIFSNASNRSAEILSNANDRAAAIQFAGMQNLGNSLASMGKSYADGITKSRENAIKYDTAAGMMETYKQNAEALGLDLNMLGGMEQKLAKDPDKLIGALTVVGKLAENNLDIEKAQKTYEALGSAYAGKAAATAAAKAALPDKMNAETIRSYAADAAAQGATQDQIKEGLLRGYGQWAVDAVFPQPKSNFWGP
jgi:hypothetical protein